MGALSWNVGICRDIEHDIGVQSKDSIAVPPVVPSISSPQSLLNHPNPKSYTISNNAHFFAVSLFSTEQ